jgi:adenine phosphoribosyltransferase
MNSLKERVSKAIRDIPDFPKPGILFKDITPILEDPQLTADVTKGLIEPFKQLKVNAVLGIESRGFFWGLLMAQALNVPFIPVRKEGKLPYKTLKHEYELEYGSAVIEVHEDAIQAGSKVLIHDDLLATGGTAEAAAKLVEKREAEVVGFSFLVILNFLKGADVLKPINPKIHSVIEY